MNNDLPLSKADLLKRKSESRVRWLILVFACLMYLGPYYCFDIPAALKIQFQEYVGNPTDYETKFQLLYTISSAPNVIMPVFGGFLIDRFGMRRCLLGFIVIIMMGQLLVCWGVTVRSWNTLYCGRFLFGVGFQCFVVAHTTILTDWFLGKELAFAFGISVSFARLGSVLNNIISPVITNSFADGLLLAFWFGFVLQLLCVIVVLMSVFVDKSMDSGGILACSSLSQLLFAPSGFAKLSSNSIHAGNADDLISDNRNSSQECLNVMISDESPTDLDAESSIEMSTFSSIHERIKMNKTSTDDILEERNDAITINFMHSSSECEGSLVHKHLCESPSPVLVSSSSQVSVAFVCCQRAMRDFASLPLVFWCVITCCATVYGCASTFNSISSTLLLERDYFRSVDGVEGCRLQSYGCQSASNSPTVACPTSEAFQPPLPYNISFEGLSFAGQVQASDVDCRSRHWQQCTSEYCSHLSAAEERASYVMSIPYLISALLSPALGFLIDRIGCRAVIGLVSCLLIVLVNLLLAETHCNPALPLVLQGVAFCGSMSAMWPAVALVVPSEVMGLAYGCTTSSLNLYLAIIPPLIAVLYIEGHTRYIPRVNFLFLGIAGVGVLSGVYLNVYDAYHQHVLNRGIQNDKKSNGGSDHVLAEDDMD